MFNWFKRPQAAFVVATSFAFLAGTDAFAASNQAAEKFDLTTTAHWDTTFTAAPSDTVKFGFSADNVVVCVPSVSSAAVTWIGQGNGTLNNTGGVKLGSTSGGIFSNTRGGLGRFKSSAFTPPVSTCYTYIGAPICNGVLITGTWTGSLLLMADRVLVNR